MKVYGTRQANVLKRFLPSKIYELDRSQAILVETKPSHVLELHEASRQ